jgi:hypothetical protein
VTNKQKQKPKGDPLFKPEITKINGELVIETSRDPLITPSPDVRTKINFKIQDPDCQLITN